MFTSYKPIDQSEPASPGIVIAAIRSDVLLRYGILKADGDVIAQVAESRTLDCSRFKIAVMAWPSFVKEADNLLRCEESTEYSYAESLSRAEGALGASREGFYSILGDDFAYWCLTGNHPSPDFDTYGEHLIIPFDEFGVLKAKHHAIGIEGRNIIHFTDNYEEVKTKPLSGLKINLTTYDEFLKNFGVPSLCKYPAESVGDKIITRNRAVNCWALQDFGDYGLFTNNCEHFAMWCKTGVQDSSQVKKLLGNLSVAAIGGLLMKRPHPAAITAISDIFKRHVKSLF